MLVMATIAIVMSYDGDNFIGTLSLLPKNGTQNLAGCQNPVTRSKYSIQQIYNSFLLKGTNKPNKTSHFIHVVFPIFFPRGLTQVQIHQNLGLDRFSFALFCGATLPRSPGMGVEFLPGPHRLQSCFILFWVAKKMMFFGGWTYCFIIFFIVMFAWKTPSGNA